MDRDAIGQAGSEAGLARPMGGGVSPAIALCLAATVLLWASSFAGIGAALEDFSPGPLTLGRFLVASIVFLGLAAARPPRRPAKRDLGLLLVLGLFGIVVYHLLIGYGQRTVSAGAAGTLSNTSPIFTALWGTLFLGERLRSLGWVGIGVAFAGAMLIGIGEGRDFSLELGALLVLLAALTWSVFFALQRRHVARFGPRDLIAWTTWVGTAGLLPFFPALLAEAPLAGAEACLALVYLGVGPTVLAYVAWAFVLSRLPVSFASGFLYLVPALAFLFGWLWLGQVPSWLTAAGGMVALAGVMLVSLRGR